jgi:hypothetical protein
MKTAKCPLFQRFRQALADRLFARAVAHRWEPLPGGGRQLAGLRLQSDLHAALARAARRLAEARR